MRNIQRIIFLILFIFAVEGSAAAVGGEVSVSAGLQESVVYAKQPVNYHVTARWTHNEKLQIPFPASPSLNGFDIAGTASTARITQDKTGTVYEKTFTYIIIPKAAGDAKIGSVTLEYGTGKNKNKISTREIQLIIQPPPVDFLPLIKKGLPGISALAALLAGGWMIVGSIRKRKAAANRKAMEKTIEEIALERIKAGEILIETDNIEYFSLISSTLREYLKKRFQLSIAGLTTSSILTALRENEISSDYLDGVEHILAACDAVKFAGHQPDKGKIRQIRDGFIHLIKKEGKANA